MRLIICLSLITSIAFADIPGAGRPDPRAFADENAEALYKINLHLEELSKELQAFIQIQTELSQITSESASLARVHEALNLLNLRIAYLIWTLDHPLCETDY